MRVCLVLLVLFVDYALSQNASNDKITSLPGVDFTINFDQYSGYLSLSNGHHLHYWFTESTNNPKTDPVVLWLNGGPGCSSLDGMMYEQGTFHVTDNGTIYQNMYAWNQNANMLFLEAPICVGFSYSDSGSCHMSDNTTADDNYHALLVFFQEFPNFISNDFYVTGESYGGVYVPTLTRRILEGNANKEGTAINLKGFAVGNGVSSDALNDDSSVWFAYHHGLIGETLWNSLMTSCCTSPYTRQNCPFSSSSNKQCQTDVNEVMNVIYGGQLNWYNIYGDCLKTTEINQKYSYTKYIHELSYIHTKFHESNDYKYIKQMIDNYNGNVPCLDTTGADIYLNRNDVKTALHIPSKVTQKWSICSSSLVYTTQYKDLTDVYKDIFSMDSSIYATVYNGDTDLSCNFLQDQWFVDDLQLTAIDKYHEWRIEDSNGPQVGGWTKNFDRLHFVTVRGSGHMVPQYKPKAALKMFQAFLNNQDL